MPLSVFGKVLGSSGRHTQVILIASMAVTLATTLVAAQKLIDRANIATLHEHATRILVRAVDIADQTDLILQKARSLDTVPCSAADLDQLRLLSFHSRFVRDVARLEKGAIACSAAWGSLSTPFALPAPHHAIAPFRFWRDIISTPIGEVQSDMTAHGAMAVVTAPGAFDGVGFADPAIKTLVLSRDGAYVFRSFGDGERLLKAFREKSLDALHKYAIALCHASRSICVVQSSPRSPLWAQSWGLLAALGFLGIFAGAGIGLTVSGYFARRSAMAVQFKRAIDREAIRVMYQPIRMLEDRRLVGVEALARWSDADGKNIPPDQFIALAEQMGWLDALTRSVLRSTFRDLGDRLRSEPSFYVSVNVASEEITNRHFRDYLGELCREHRIPASRVALEVTERSTADYVDLGHAFQALRDAGHMVMIDDFGTGYSNFAYLAALPLDAIKMDRAFTNAIGTESLASEVIPGIMSIASALKVQLIVEGIETEAQEQLLKTLHPQARGQGWLYGRPATAADLTTV
ncbi:MAG: EAL domain-containing protein [Comamonas sp.]|uniref:EAL domain-containing protein n=1 Tax=Comamonas sp. TaxID=34028 RepID=UPI002FC81E8B